MENSFQLTYVHLEHPNYSLQKLKDNSNYWISLPFSEAIFGSEIGLSISSIVAPNFQKFCKTVHLQRRFRPIKGGTKKSIANYKENIKYIANFIANYVLFFETTLHQNSFTAFTIYLSVRATFQTKKISKRSLDRTYIGTTPFIGPHCASVHKKRTKPSTILFVNESQLWGLIIKSWRRRFSFAAGFDNNIWCLGHNRVAHQLSENFA